MKLSKTIVKKLMWVSGLVMLTITLLASAKVSTVHVVHKSSIKQCHSYNATVKAGDVLSNLQNLCSKYHWHLVWDLGEYNYSVIGNMHYQSSEFGDLVKQVIANYPLRAMVYNKNKVLVIKSDYNLMASHRDA